MHPRAHAPCMQVNLRARVHNVRGKGKSAFVVLREQTSTVQAVLFADDSTVSKGMVKYASTLTRETVVDIVGEVVCPEQPVVSCSQSLVRGDGRRKLCPCSWCMWW